VCVWGGVLHDKTLALDGRDATRLGSSTQLQVAGVQVKGGEGGCFMTRRWRWRWRWPAKTQRGW
jgi:hypothetical protein